MASVVELVGGFLYVVKKPIEALYILCEMASIGLFDPGRQGSRLALTH